LNAGVLVGEKITAAAIADCISSNMSDAPYCVQSWRRSLRKEGSGIFTPPTPCMPSTITAQISSLKDSRSFSSSLREEK